jgi:hypothetical protein
MQMQMVALLIEHVRREVVHEVYPGVLEKHA